MLFLFFLRTSERSVLKKILFLRIKKERRQGRKKGAEVEKDAPSKKKGKILASIPLWKKTGARQALREALRGFRLGQSARQWVAPLHNSVEHFSRQACLRALHSRRGCLTLPRRAR